MFAGVALYGFGTLVLGKSAWLPLSLAALGLMGAGDMVSVYVRHMLVQLETPDAIRGRVARIEGVVDARVIQRLNYPEYVVNVDRAKAADLGLTQEDVMRNVVAAPAVARSPQRWSTSRSTKRS